MLSDIPKSLLSSGVHRTVDLSGLVAVLCAVRELKVVFGVPAQRKPGIVCSHPDSPKMRLNREHYNWLSLMGVASDGIFHAYYIFCPTPHI